VKIDQHSVRHRSELTATGLTGHPDIAHRYRKCSTESIVAMKCNLADNERIIGKYMKITDPKLAATEFDFVISLMPDYPAPTLDGIRLILEHFGKEYPEAPRSEGVRRWLVYRAA
jgi:hypothetical protein